MRKRLLITLLLSGIFSLAALTDGFAQSTTRVSVSSGGVQGDGDSFAPSISTDGSFVVFSSDATNLVANDTNTFSDIFVRDRQTNQTTRVTADSTGLLQADGISSHPSISSNGDVVAFQSAATNLVASDTNSHTDIFVHEISTGTTTLVSVSSGGVQGDGDSFAPSISSDGSVVAFQSLSTNLVANDTNGDTDIFVHEISTGTTTLVSVSSGGAQGDGDSVAPSISSDGRFVAFSSDATNLVAGDTNGLSDIFVRDRQTNQTTRVSVDSSGTQATGGASSAPSISSDGRFVAFSSDATNLVAGDTNGHTDIFVHDRNTGATTLVSVSSGGAQGDGDSFAPSISSDGRFVAFSSDATNLVANDTNGLADIFVRDRQTNQTTRVSVDSSGTQATGGGSSAPSISSDGRFIAFESLATNLVTGDTNGSSDIFVRDQGGSFLGSGGAGGGGSCFIDTAAGCISKNLGRALFLLVAAAAFAAAVRLKAR